MKSNSPQKEKSSSLIKCLIANISKEIYIKRVRPSGEQARMPGWQDGRMAASGLNLCPVHGRTPQSGEWLSDNNIIIILNVVIIIFHHHQIFVPSTNQPPKKPELHHFQDSFSKERNVRIRKLLPKTKTIMTSPVKRLTV